MLPFQAYDALEELGALEPIRAAGRDIPPHRNGSPVAIAVGREQVVRILREGVDVRWDQEVMDLTRDGERVTGVRVGGAEAALAPGLGACRRGFAGLLPAAAEPLAALTSIDQVRYGEVVEVRCETWWAPGVALVGEALHAMNPEAGIGSGLGRATPRRWRWRSAATPATPTPPAATTSTGAGPRWHRIWRWARRPRRS